MGWLHELGLGQIDPITQKYIDLGVIGIILVGIIGAVRYILIRTFGENGLIQKLIDWLKSEYDEYKKERAIERARDATRQQREDDRQDAFFVELAQSQREHTTEIRKMADDVRMLRQQAQEASVAQEKNVVLLREEFSRSLAKFEKALGNDGQATRT